ncbi:hypothetical protein MNBD_GAMMA18-481 [hydrothermal vent metagenome]|uniref:Uncharacterized protein n=1 Tax=hydrothermal vent metagenome TaxID=652676 RepID=A0A3B0Z821_9ZZZZ
MQQITAIKLKQRLNDDQLVLLNIREMWKYEIYQHGMRGQQIPIWLKQNAFE